MSYLSINPEQRAEMLSTIGLETERELFSDIPEAGIFEGELNVAGGYSELELSRRLDDLVRRNMGSESFISFLGAGIYDHFSPAYLDQLLLKPEFFTAYTPYQPEVSQGTLQAMYEYQTGICELTGMDIANASMYDGATAMVEAGLMAIRLKKKREKLLVAGTIHPEYLETLRTYADPGIFEYEITAEKDALIDLDDYRSKLDESVAAVILPYTNFYGSLEPLKELIALAKEQDALVIVVANPTLLSVLESPGALGADIVVGEAQTLGLSMSLGGPGLGYFACKTAHMRQMPGRISGRTTDVDGNDGYVLTLSTREQHIRREKATSNICSNHALMALAAGAYLAGVGEAGLKSVAVNASSLAHYLRSELIKTAAFESVNDTAFAYEFTLKFKGDAEEFLAEMADRGYLAGYAAGDNRIIFAVTEKRSKDEVDAFVKEVLDYVG